MKVGLGGSILALVTLSGCATVETTGIGLGKPGIPYHLPKGEFELTVVDNQGVLAVHLAGPVMVPDPEYPLIANLPQSGTSDNVVTITVDPKTNLLAKVDAASTGQLSTIIRNVVQTVAFLQSSEGESGNIIFDRSYDINALQKAAGDDVNHFWTNISFIPATTRSPIRHRIRPNSPRPATPTNCFRPIARSGFNIARS